MSTIEGPYILGISEKPQAAQRIARALDKNNKPELNRIKNVPVYICQRDGIKIVIAPALGHLFALSSISKTWNYPVLDYEWRPNYEVNKSAKTKNFIDVFKSLSKKATDIIVMTDFDREGEVIGYLILKYIFGRDQAERMKFSTLTRRDIIEAYDNREKTLDSGFLNSGLIRHYVDWLYGINYSRALSSAFKRVSGRFKTISIGRVQGPTLNSVVELEKEINLFLPIPYWTIESEVILESKNFKASYEKSRINNQKEASQIVDDCKSLVGKVKDIIQEKKSRYPFPPFNLGDLQREAYIHFKFSPHKTLEIGEKLYLSALISYPRTDSQKLPMTLGHKSILAKLENQSDYKDHANEIITIKKYKPSEGRKTDAAHPAIHPTGNKPDKNLSPGEKKLYDLIVKRYLSLFGKPALLSNKTIIIEVNKHKFEVRGSQIIDEGWIKYYKPYYSLKEQILPEIDIENEIKFNFIDAKERLTSPPYRYNESTLLRKMEDEKIGTKATRAGIIQTLFARGYIEGSIIKATPLGFAVVSVLQEQYPVLVKSEMTRNLEEIMETVQDQEKDIDKIILSIKKELKTMLISFHTKELEIGSSLYKNLKKSEESKIIVLGKCTECKKGNLRIIKSKKTGKRFIACSSYFDKAIKCSATYPLPSTGIIKATSQKCSFDGLPIIEWRKGKLKQIMCISPECPSKKKGD
ncbi:MAG: DNA topoisomerase I [Candidatus Heimdallarchaeota archaeon]|nr:DNA topoisomerase I [Candidatus Heimdallarchaeota archaeon]MCK4876571.1 DNA topoisomerase I [Candidatus Heimdallarchaeota archaeon]